MPEEHFADVAMLLEFLNTFGPLFEVEEVIQRKITFGMIMCSSVNDIAYNLIVTSFGLPSNNNMLLCFCTSPSLG